MTAETEATPGGAAPAAARAWQAIELPPELRRGVEAAAKSAGIEPEAWLTRAVLAAAGAPAPRGRQAEASALTLDAPGRLEEDPTQDGAAPDIRLTTEREHPVKQLPILYRTRPRGRRTFALALLVIVVGAVFGAGAFFIRYGGVPSTAGPVLKVSLPPASGPGPADSADAAAVGPAAPSAPAPTAPPSAA